MTHPNIDAWHGLVDDGDDHPEWPREGGLNPARGIVLGIALSVPMWLAIAWAGGLFA